VPNRFKLHPIAVRSMVSDLWSDRQGPSTKLVPGVVIEIRNMVVDLRRFGGTATTSSTSTGSPERKNLSTDRKKGTLYLIHLFRKINYEKTTTRKRCRAKVRSS
jgi:hypothetical protein